MLRPIRLVVALVGAIAMVFAVALPASAHVTINNTPQVTAGSYAKLTFSVPNERETANTKKLKIVLPVGANQALPNVLAQRTPGWTLSIEKNGSGIGAGVVSLTWTANSSAHTIPAGQFEEFSLMGGLVPNTDRIYFDAIQTYSNGEVVSWDERPTSSNPNPAHPAPSVKVVPAAAAGAGAATAAKTMALGPAVSGGDGSVAAAGSPAATAAYTATAVLAVAGGLFWMRRRSRRTSLSG
ncbi:YcnI family protein [Streptomyces sp. NPDC014894]|uniref:YcnI family copper-binding membrane protein n=1 Tax=Streptomyces sp. NPDC014894 TaxID=3364931 RepID=UPI0036FEB830